MSVPVFVLRGACDLSLDARASPVVVEIRQRGQSERRVLSVSLHENVKT